MKNVRSGMGVKNISDLVLKEIHGIRKTKINQHRMTEREIYENFSNLSKKELNTKSNKNVCIKNVVWLLLLNAVEAKK